MAVVLQRIVGSARGGRFYPDFSGVGAVAQLLSPAADASRRTASRPSRSGWARPSPPAGRASASARATRATSSSSRRRPTRWQQHAARVPRARARPDRAASGDSSRPGSTCARPRKTDARRAWLDLFARERRGLRRRLAARRPPGHLRAAAQARASFRSPSSSTPCWGWRPRASAARSRSNSPSTSRPTPAGLRSSGCCSCARWRACASCPTSRSRRWTNAASSAGARARSAMGAWTTCAIWWSSTRTGSIGARSRDVVAEVARFNAELAAARTPYILVGVGTVGIRRPVSRDPCHVGSDLQAPARSSRPAFAISGSRRRRGAISSRISWRGTSATSR